jgi:hypothetical protein
MSTIVRLEVLDEIWGFTVEEYKLDLLAHSFVMQVGVPGSRDYPRHEIEMAGVISFVYDGESTDEWDYIQLTGIEAERLVDQGEPRWKVSCEWWSSTFDVVCERLRIDGEEVLG